MTSRRPLLTGLSKAVKGTGEKTARMVDGCEACCQGVKRHICIGRMTTPFERHCKENKGGKPDSAHCRARRRRVDKDVQSQN